VSFPGYTITKIPWPIIDGDTIKVRNTVLPSIIRIRIVSYSILAGLIALIYLGVTWRAKPDQVIKVVDGDTLVISYQGWRERVRLLRVNTSERDRYGYKQATVALGKLVEDRDIRLAFEIPGKLRRDEYGRILAYVFVDDMNVNIEMVRLGWSRFWTKFGKGKYADEFWEAEQDARREKRGLWKSKNIKHKK